jgi:hypothetical protein
MTDTYEYMHKAVIALNNTGVSLIDHGLYYGAIETLKDSMRLMKGFVHMKNDHREIRGETLTTTHSSSSTGTANRMDYDAALQAACRRKTLIHHRRNEDVTKNQNVLVISEHDHPCTVFDHLLQHPARAQRTRPLLCCVTIDLLPNDDDDGNSHRLQQESALILYNLSIAYKCLANASSLSSTSSDCHRISFHLMEYAYTVLCSVLQSISTCGELLMTVSLDLFLITFLILNTLQEMSLENSSLRDKHVHYSVAYKHIVTAMAERFMHTAEEEIQMFLGAAAA